jgi:hypothetical protein
MGLLCRVIASLQPSYKFSNLDQTGGCRVQKPSSAMAPARRRKRQPVIINQNGKPAGVLVSPTEYDRLTERERFDYQRPFAPT